MASYARSIRKTKSCRGSVEMIRSDPNRCCDVVSSVETGFFSSFPQWLCHMYIYIHIYIYICHGSWVIPDQRLLGFGWIRVHFRAYPWDSMGKQCPGSPKDQHNFYQWHRSLLHDLLLLPRCLGDGLRKYHPPPLSYINLIQWIGLRENLQETIVFTIKYRGFPSSNSVIDTPIIFCAPSVNST